MQDREPDEFRESTSFFQIWLLFRQNRVALFCFYLFCLLILTALFPKLIMPYSESMEFVGEELMPPSWVEKGRIAFFFGTDDLGRDVLSRLIMGTQYTLGSSLLVVIAVAIIGGALGILAGMSEGIKSRFLGHFFDAFLSIPILLIAIIISDVNGTELNKCHVCHSVGYFAVFCTCHLSSNSARAKERLRTLTKIRWYFKLGIIKNDNLAEY